MKRARRFRYFPVIRLCFCTAIAFAAAPSFGATTYKFDIDRTESLVTMPGWTSFPVGNADTTVTHVVDGIDFRLSSADGARLRGTVDAPVPDALLADFAFDDGDNQAIIFHFGTAGQLPANIWQVDVYSLDSGGGIAVEDQILGLRRNGAETIIATDVVETDMGPAYSFRFRSDGVSAYDIFLRENNANFRTRLNGVVLSTIPEPGTLAIVGLAGLALVGFRRRLK